MLVLSPGTHYVTKEAWVPQIKGKVIAGVQPVFCPSQLPTFSLLSPSLLLTPPIPSPNLSLCGVQWGQGVILQLSTCRMVTNTEQMLPWVSWQTGNCYTKFKNHGTPTCCREDGRWNNRFLFPMKLLNSLCEIFWYTCLSMRSSRRKGLCLSRFAKITSNWKNDLVKEMTKY